MFWVVPQSNGCWFSPLTAGHRANVLRSYSCKRVQAAKFLVKTKWG